MLTPETLAKLTRLRRLLKADERVVLAYSGGIDSSLLAYLGHQMLGDHLLAVTCVSPLLPPAERIAARRFAAGHGIRHMEWTAPDLDCEAVAHNAPDRCYHCKYRRFTALLEYARARLSGGLGRQQYRRSRSIPAGLASAAGTARRFTLPRRELYESGHPRCRPSSRSAHLG